MDRISSIIAFRQLGSFSANENVVGSSAFMSSSSGSSSKGLASPGAFSNDIDHAAETHLLAIMEGINEVADVARWRCELNRCGRRWSPLLCHCRCRGRLCRGVRCRWWGRPATPRCG